MDYIKQLNQIANILMLNCQKANGQGLLSGPLGIAMFFYHYARFVDAKRYFDFADGILSDTIETSLNIATRDFAKGFLGIGWSMKYLSNFHFVQLQKDSLAEIERMLTKKHGGDVDWSLSGCNDVFAEGLFVIGMDERIVAEILHKLYRILHKPVRFSLCYLNSVMYFLSRLPKKLLKSFVAKKVTSQLRVLLTKYYVEASAPCRDVYIFNRLCRHFGIEKLQPRMQMDVMEDIYMNWQTVVYSCMPTSSEILPVVILDQYLERITCDVPYSKLSLDGLASLGINLIVRDRKYKN